MTDIAALGLKVDFSDSDKAAASLGRLRSSATDAEHAVAGLINGVRNLAIAYGGLKTVEAIVRKFVDSTVEAEAAQNRLQAVLTATGGSAGVTAKAATDLASSLQNLTSYGDEAILGAETMMLTFRNIGSEVFPRATEAVLDLATTMGGDLNGAAVQVGKALNDPIQGITALTRVGITFDQSQKSMIKSLVETGDVAGAQAVILKELEGEMGGTAKAARHTLGGALTALGEAFGNLFEANGPGSERLRDAVEDLIKTISDPNVIASVSGFGAAMFEGFAKAVEMATKLQGIINPDKATIENRYRVTNGVFASPNIEDRTGGVIQQTQDLAFLGKNPSFGDLSAFGAPKTSSPVLGPTADQISKMEEAQKAYDKLTESTRTRVDGLNTEAESLGMTNAAAELLKNTQDLLAQAEATGIPITEERRAQIEALAGNLTDAQLALEGLHMTLENATPWEKMGRSVEKLQEQLARKDITQNDFNIGVGKSVEEMAGSYASAANNIIGSLENITDAMGLEGKKAFEVQKTLSLARAVVAGGEAIVHAYNAGMVFGLPGAITFAGIAAAATAAQIASIASSTYQSKTAVGSGASGSAGAAATPTPSRQSTLINLVGNSNTQVSLGDVKSLLDRLNDEASANGMEIVTRFKGEN